MAMVDFFRAGSIVIMGLAVLGGWASMPLIYGSSSSWGRRNLFANAFLAILPSVVPKESLEKDNGRLFAAELVTNRFGGGPLGSALFAAAIPFLLDAGAFAASAAPILALRGRFRLPQARRPA